MAFFKLRWPGHQEQAEKSSKRSRTAQTESMDAIRRRARHRLMGAAILVVIGVLVFPMLFDTQPRPILVDIPIQIPDRQTVTPLTIPPALSHSNNASNTANGVATNNVPLNVGNDGLSEGEEAVAGVGISPRASLSAQPRTEPASTHNNTRIPPAFAPSNASSKTSASNPVEALAPTPTDPKVQRSAAVAPTPPVSTTGTSTDERFIVQVGAFAENDKAREVRLKLEKAGIKTYTQVIETKDGKRIRVRVGPLANRVEAEKAAARIKSLSLPAAILTL
jgi:DedD protein